MTLTALKREALQLPPAQRQKLANALLHSLPPLGRTPTLEELEARADEALSGRVKGIPAEVVFRGLRSKIDQIARKQAKR